MKTEQNVFNRIYEVVKSIPKGKVMSYGQVAALAGNPRWARVVGYALHVNPSPSTIPCFRVVMKDGSLTSGFAFGGEDAQRNLLLADGVKFDKDGKVIMSEFQVKM